MTATSGVRPDRGIERDAPQGGGPAGPDAETADGLVAPAKIVRMREVLRRGLDELNLVSPDDEALRRLVEAHKATLIEAASTVSDELIEEMVRLHIEPLAATATLDQLKVATSQLLGWVNGLMAAEAEEGGSNEPVSIARVLAVEQPALGDEG